MDTHFALTYSKRNSNVTKCESGVWSHRREDRPENHVSLTVEDVVSLKRLLKSAAPTRFCAMSRDE